MGVDIHSGVFQGRNTWPQNGLSEAFWKLLKLWEVGEHLDFWISAVIPGFLKFRQKTSPSFFFENCFCLAFQFLVPTKILLLKKSVFYFCWETMSLPVFVGVMNSLLFTRFFQSKAFQRYDATNDGFLDIDELAHTLKVRRCVFFFVCWVELKGVFLTFAGGKDQRSWGILRKFFAALQRFP